MLESPIEKRALVRVGVAHRPAWEVPNWYRAAAQQFHKPMPAIHSDLPKKGIHLGLRTFELLIVDVVLPVQKSGDLFGTIIPAGDFKHVALDDTPWGIKASLK